MMTGRKPESTCATTALLQSALTAEIEMPSTASQGAGADGGGPGGVATMRPPAGGAVSGSWLAE